MREACQAGSAPENLSRSANGLPQLKITEVKAILTAPSRSRLIVLKVETSEPGLYGIGLRQRLRSVLRLWLLRLIDSWTTLPGS